MKTIYVFNYGTCDTAHIEFDETECETMWDDMDNDEKSDYESFDSFRTSCIDIEVAAAISKHHGRMVAHQGYRNLESVSADEYEAIYRDIVRF